MAKRWYIGLTKDQQELKAAAGLREQKFLVYLPKKFTRWQEGRKIEARGHLRFTGYLFVAFDYDAEEHGPIKSTPGMDDSDGSALVKGAAGGGDRPAALRPGIIDMLRAVEDEEFARAIERKKPGPRADLVSGCTVEINNRLDPFHGQRGTYLSSEKGIATVLLGFIAKEIADCDLKKIEQPEKRAA